MAVEFSRDGSVAFVCLNNPPVNAIGHAVRQGLIDALSWVAGETGLTRVILQSAVSAFAAGADAREFDAGPTAPHLPDIVRRIENCEVPWIAAITGVALGGGCELVLGCRYRIAQPHAKLGLPEVTLGVVPGAGGTQRLPRLIGMTAALEMISTGRPVTAARAQTLGLVDEIADDPVQVATDLDPEVLGQARPINTLPAPVANADAVQAAREFCSKKMPTQIAPMRAIDLVAASFSLSFEAGLREERETFLELRVGRQARALRHLFFAERAAKLPEDITADPVSFKTIAVVGGGTMGAGIAYALLSAGLRVVLIETDDAGVARARKNVEGIIDASLKRGLIATAQAAERRKGFSASSDYSDASAATLAIEAAFESIEVKQTIFGALQDHLPAEAILATNTSYLDVNEIASCLDDPTRLLGLHFFAPAHIMKLLEIVSGDQTSDAAIATGFALAKHLRKVPVLSGVCDGFIGNRILARYREAADAMLIDGSTPSEIDEAMVAFGYAVGPYAAQDLSGLDIAHANRRRQDATRDPNRRYIPIADRMVELGRLGQKTGAGWYCYSGGGKADDPGVTDLILEEALLAKISRKNFVPELIMDRLVLAMINEAGDILYEGIAASARDIDLVTVFGYGFPRWRGGLMHYADRLGVQAIQAALEKLALEDHTAWTPSPIFQDCLRMGIPLSAYQRDT